MSDVTIQQASQGPSVILSRIGMLLNARNCCLIVEGPDDYQFYGKFTRGGHCFIIKSESGKEGVIKLISILEGRQLKGMLGIVDADFSKLDNIAHVSPNILETDTHDLETMLINSPALDNVLLQYGFDDATKICPSQAGRDIRELLLQAGRVIGYFRWVNHRHNFALIFNNLKFNFIDKKTLSIDLSTLIDEVMTRSQNQTLQKQDIIEKIKELEDSSHDPWHLCCGHDLTDILRIGIQEAMKAKKPSKDTIEKDLRLAYEYAYFCKSQLYQSILEWEKNNKPFRVFAPSN